MHSASLPIYTPSPSIRIRPNPNPKPFIFGNSTARKSNDASLITCRASSSVSSIAEFDLYDLLGVDSTSDQSQIKVAYRALQKQCHPDIAGPAGHDMAIILNEAYALLSDPPSRLAYDKEQAKISDLRGYTGKPIYSAWFGSESEQRAVFVDEVKCVGCLKCALFAENTFAVESVYGRARVVAQWADPEDKIQGAIESCPVDCISIVERSNLAALEFLMSKQPRGNVRIGSGNTAGTRVSNIFVDVEKFQARYEDSVNKSSAKHSKEADTQREARMSAIQAIRAVSNWLYWKSPSRGGATSDQSLTPFARKSAKPDIKKLRDAAGAIKRAGGTIPRQRISSRYILNDEYWIPSNLVLPEETGEKSGAGPTSESCRRKEPEEPYNEDVNLIMQNNNHRDPVLLGVPTMLSTMAAVVVRLQGGEGGAGLLEEHVGGSLALDIVNSSWLQVVLAGVTWYLIGMAIVELVESIRSKLGIYGK